MAEQVTLQKQRPVIVDGKLWKAVKSLHLRDGTAINVSKVVHVDTHHIVIVPVGSDELLLIPKHAIDRAELHRERFVKGE